MQNFHSDKVEMKLKIENTRKDVDDLKRSIKDTDKRIVIADDRLENILKLEKSSDKMDTNEILSEFGF